MAIYRRILASPTIPWRLRHGLECWVESDARNRYPALYRWLHFGRAADPVKPVTTGPLHHFFGYYDKSPWNASGSLLLGHEAGFNDRAPTADDQVGIGIVSLSDGNRFAKLADSLAWNWQQGAMLQWHPADMENRFLHNDRRNGAHVGIVRDVSGCELAVYDRPIYAVSPDGETGFSVNFARLAVHRPGYGYAGLEDPWQDDPHPSGDGIWLIDLQSGNSDLVISLSELAARAPKPSMQAGFHYVNHIQPSRNGKWIAFFHIWTTGNKTWEVRLYVCRPDGSDLRCLLDSGTVSHYDWLGDESILVWAAHPTTGKRHFLHVALDGVVDVFGASALSEDGHCTFSPDQRWVLNDTYPDRFDIRTLMLVKWPEGTRVDLARLYSPKSRWWGEIRCDLHPRWSRDGKRVCIDSVHDRTRQIYVMDTREWTA
jgi:hypothetical protein